MREYHPDRNPSPEVGEQARTVIAAWKLLSDFDQRSHYDWDRRRVLEQVIAQPTVPDLSLDKKAVVVGAIGAAIVAVAIITSSAILPPVDALVGTAAPRPALPDARPKPKPRRDQTIIRMRRAVPVLGRHKPTNGAFAH